MAIPSYKEYESLREEEFTNSNIATMFDTTVAHLGKLGYVKRYSETHPIDMDRITSVKPVGFYLNTNSEEYQKERAPRKALMAKADKLRFVLHERYGDYSLYPDDDPDWVELKKINRQMMNKL